MATLDPALRTLPTDAALLEQSWRPPPGLLGWLSHVNHKQIGRRYVATGLALFLLAGLEALAIRTQLAVPENGLLGPETYRQMFTMHGATMMFLFAVPIMEGIGIYLVPLMIGARDMALPRLNAFGYWIYLIGALTLYAAFLLGVAPNAGWFNYPPLARREHELGIGIDVWTSVITLLEVAALVGAVGLIVTIFKQRAPGMSLNRMPIFVWSILVMCFMIVFAMPTLMTASVFLALDRRVGAHFFDPAGMGDPLLWQHLFWFFGHPEVYIMFIPAAGFVSEIVPVFARRKLFGHTAMVLALVATGFVSFGLWVHHMFTTGVPQLGQSFFTAASVMIAIPSGVQVFCWIGTLWAGRPRFDTPLLFSLGFIALFVLGGITGVMVASVPFDQQAHDSYFVVAHFHYVQVGAFVFPLFAAFYFWFPKLTGRMLSERLGKWNFWLFFLGVNVTFFPMHFLGMMGMTRRVYTYLPETGWGDLNLLATAGAVMIAVSVVAFLGNVAWSLRRGPLAGDDPWGAHTLEWATHSPPPPYNFLHVPVVQGLYALWERTPDRPVVTGISTKRPEVLLTTVLDAGPDSLHEHPGPAIWPLLVAMAVGVTFIGAIFTPWAFVAGPALMLPPMVMWGWPRHKPPPSERTFEEEPA